MIIMYNENDKVILLFGSNKQKLINAVPIGKKYKKVRLSELPSLEYQEYFEWDESDYDGIREENGEL